MNQSDKISKETVLGALEHIDLRHPSEFYVSQEDQIDQPDAAWTLRYSYDSGNVTGRLLSDKELRLVLLKALAYDDLVANLGLKNDT